MVIAADQTLTDWLATHAAQAPDSTAIVDARGTMSYAELADAVTRLCSGLAQSGIGTGDVVGVQLPNVREFVVAFLAIAARGGIVQTLHMPYRRNELSGLLADSAAKAVILTHADAESRAVDVLSIREDLPALTSVIVAGPALDGTLALSDLMQTAPDPADRASLAPDMPYLLLYTSGTTAAPKGVPHTYRGFLNNALLSAGQLLIAADGRVLSLAPMSHLYGLFTMHLALSAGAAIALVPAFRPDRMMDDLVGARATHVFAAPAHFAGVAAHPDTVGDALSGIRVICLSGSKVPESLARAVDHLMPDGEVIQLWGMSELQAGCYGRPADPAEKRFTTAGRASPGTELRVVSDESVPCAAGQEGALQMRGPSLFGGYLNRPDETQKAFEADGWFSTGDLAVIDADGFVTITGRTKEIINRGGVKYNPIEVEEVLMALPEIAQCAIVPVPDAELGERGCLCVQLAPGSGLTLDDACAALNAARMAKFKWPERLLILDDLPMTPTRKVMRGALVQKIRNMEGP